MRRPHGSAYAVLGVALLVLTVGCSERVNVLGNIALDGDPVRGRELVGTFECNRCHQPRMEVDGRNCLSCHTAIGEGRGQSLPGRPAGADLEAWARDIRHYREVPSLHATGKLLRRDWLVRFLRAPHDLRPRLSESMPRLEVSETDAKDIVEYLRSAESKEPYFADTAIGDWRKAHGPKLPEGDLVRGRKLFHDEGCIACHVYGGAVVAPTITADRLEDRKLQLAVDLRFTRERFQPAELVPWLLAPRHHKVDAVMPQLELTYQQARDLAAFIMDEPLSERVRPKPPRRLVPLDRPVGFAEVDAALFSRTCVHCHDDDDLGVLGDGGPGNVGGFGFRPRRLSFASYESLHAGYVDDDGERRSIFASGEDGRPLLLEVLLIRRDEEAGWFNDSHRGMPLSLPSVTAEVLQLVESWLDQGHPR
jgi:mono/diheme cytochrome c family protein